VSIITNHCDFLDNRCTAAGEEEIIEDPVCVRDPLRVAIGDRHVGLRKVYSTSRPDVKEGTQYSIQAEEIFFLEKNSIKEVFFK